MRSGKLEWETVGKIFLLLVFFLIVLIIAQPLIKIIFVENAREQAANNMKSTTCWISNIFIDSFSFLGIVPQACNPIEIETPVNQADLSRLMRWCWWMYGRGAMDLGITNTGVFKQSIPGTDHFYVCYVFKVNEEVKTEDLFTNMKKTKRGKQYLGDIDDSDWNYVQEGSTGNTICIDKEKTKGVLHKYDEKTGTPIYYLSFYDCRELIGTCLNDRLLISSDPRFGDVNFLTNINDKCVEAGTIVQ